MAKTYKFRCGDFTEIYESDSDEDAREVLNGRVRIDPPTGRDGPCRRYL